MKESMNTRSIGQSKSTSFSLQENDFPPLTGKKYEVMRKEIQKASHVANTNLQTPLQKSAQDKKPQHYNVITNPADLEKAKAQYKFAMLCFKGEDRNFEKGEYWLKKSSELGYFPAKRELHMIHFQGEDILLGRETV